MYEKQKCPDPQQKETYVAKVERKDEMVGADVVKSVDNISCNLERLIALILVIML